MGCEKNNNDNCWCKTCKNLYYFYKRSCERGFSSLRSYRAITGPETSLPSKHPLRGTYTRMLARCYDSSCSSYPRYGGRGIKVCARWFYSFSAFVEDMGERPENMTLDRIDNNLGYSPDNCAWRSRSTQTANRNLNSMLGLQGVYETKAGTYQARVVFEKKCVFRKTFKTVQEAVEARNQYLDDHNLPHTRN